MGVAAVAVHHPPVGDDEVVGEDQRQPGAVGEAAVLEPGAAGRAAGEQRSAACPAAACASRVERSSS